jgi:hypothetical protein
MFMNKLKIKFNRMEAPVPLVLLLIIAVPWGFFLFHEPPNYSQMKTAGITAFVFFSFAFLLYPFLLSIQKLPIGKTTAFLVQFTRRFIRFHMPAAILGVLFVLPHAAWMAYTLPITNFYTLTGYLTSFALAGVLFTGYLRSQKSSGKRRRYHRYLSFLFVLLLLVHVLS